MKSFAEYTALTVAIIAAYMAYRAERNAAAASERAIELASSAIFSVRSSLPSRMRDDPLLSTYRASAALSGESRPSPENSDKSANSGSGSDSYSLIQAICCGDSENVMA